MKPMTDAEFREMVRKAQVAHYYFAMGHRGDDTPYGTRDTCVNIYADLRADNERLSIGNAAFDAASAIGGANQVEGRRSKVNLVVSLSSGEAGVFKGIANFDAFHRLNR